MKDGNAFCVSCGREPEQEKPEPQTNPSSTLETLEKKLHILSKELANEGDHEKQQNILKSINSLVDTIEKLKNKQ